MTSIRRERGAAGALLVLTAAAWFVAVRRTRGMDMDLGSLWFFLGAWTAMMTAMMLPSALPVIAPRSVPSAFGFLAAYLALWLLAGLAIYAAYDAIRSVETAVLVIAAGLYELTPLKRRCLGRCRATARYLAGNGIGAGLRYGTSCIGCNAGLMTALIALGVMSVPWMLAIAALLTLEKVPPFGARVVPGVAVSLLVLGVWVAINASSVPGLT